MLMFMSNAAFRILFLLLTAACLASCTMQKRHYRAGFYISRHGDRMREQQTRNTKDTIEPALRAVTNQQEDAQAIAQKSDTIATPHCGEPREVLTKEKQSTIPSAALEEQKDPPAERTEQPGAEKDKPNRTILLMMIGAMLLVALIFFFAVPFLGWWVYVVAALGPVAGLLVYLAALMVRKKFVRKNMAGSTDKKYRLSKWYHKFALPLHLLFGSVLLAGLGFVMSYALGFALDGFLSVLGILIMGAGMTSVSILSIVLLVITLLYFFKWRKSGEQKTTPDEKRRKDG
jgi:membrane protein implicated in regulation of membrane protease activity